MRTSLALVLLVPTFGWADVTPFLPAGTDAVLVIESKKVAESDLMQDLGADLLKQALRASKQAATAITASGLDPFKDFERVTIGVDVDADPPKPFAMLEGKFDSAKLAESIANYIKANPGSLEPLTVAGKPAYKVPGGKPTETMFAAAIDSTRLVIAPTEKDLAGAFEAAAGTRKPVVGKELANLLATTKPTGPIFLWAWVKGKFDKIDLPNDKLKERLKGVDWLTASIAVTKDVTITLTANTADPAAAKQLSHLTGGLISLVRLQIVAASDDQPELKPVADLLRATKVAPKGKQVVATGSVKGVAIQKALNAPPVKKAKE